MKVTEGVRRIIVEWRGKGVPPEETAQSLRIPVDEQDMYRGTITLALLRWIGHLEQFSQITNQQDKDDA